MFTDRSDIQKSRQKCFRKVTKSANEISRECTKRVLCEQACKDGLNGQVRQDYPEVLPNDNPENVEYVNAYSDGERFSCFQVPDENHPYNATSCENDCQKKFPECDRDLESSKMANIFVKSGRAFHNTGMWWFSAIWANRDSAEEFLKTSEGQSVKQLFASLYKRMAQMDECYISSVIETYYVDVPNEIGDVRDRVVDSLLKQLKRTERDLMLQSKAAVEDSWNQFLIEYNKTDPGTVDVVYEILNYDQFKDTVAIINDTLATYDFGPESSVASQLSMNVFVVVVIFLYF